jgi:LacI family transcriptional regulator
MAGGVTIRDVARHARVANGTVSRVLNGAGDVAPELRSRVLEAIEALGYRRVPVASPRREVRGGQLAFLVVRRDAEERHGELGTFWAPIMHGAEHEARRRGVRLSYHPLTGLDRGRGVAAQLAGELPDLALLVGPAPAGAVAELHHLGVPTVLVDNAVPALRSSALVSDNAVPGLRTSDGTVPDLRMSAVVSDNFGGTIQTMRYLLDAGHRRIAFLGGPTVAGCPHQEEIYTVEWRAMAYRTALTRAGVAPDPRMVEHCDLSPEGGFAATRRLLATAPPFSAVCCANDPTAVGAIRALREAGRRVPADVSVVGFDDQFGAHTQPRLTTVRADRAAMGAVAVRLLVEQASDPGYQPVTVVLPTTFVAGESVAAPPPASS